MDPRREGNAWVGAVIVAFLIVAVVVMLVLRWGQ